MRRAVALVAAVVVWVAGCGSGEAPVAPASDTVSPTSSPSPVAAPTSPGPSPSVPPSPAGEPSATAAPSPSTPLAWEPGQLLAADSPLPVLATAVAGPGGAVGYREVTGAPGRALTRVLHRPTDAAPWGEVATWDGLEVAGLLAGGPGYVLVGTRNVHAGDADLHVAPWAAWSADGRTWEEGVLEEPSGAGGSATTDGPNIDGSQVVDVVETPHGFVALGHDWTGGAANVVWTSIDGRAWELLPGDPFGADVSVGGLASGQGRLVAHGHVRGPGDTPGPVVTWSSVDGRSWTRGSPHPSFEDEFGEGPLVAGVVPAADSFVMVSAGVVAPPMAWRSVDGLVWQEPVELPSLGDTSASVHAVAAGGGRVVAVGRELQEGAGLEPGVQYPAIWSSTDGHLWAQAPPQALRGNLEQAGIQVDTAAPVEGGWIALGRAWDYPDEVTVTVAWVAR